MKRCFVGLRIDDEARRSIEALQEELRDVPAHAAEKIRPVRAASLHLTVAFLGATPDAQLDALGAALADAAAATALVGAAPVLQGIGAFPSHDRPRAIFAAVTGGREAMVDLMQRVEACCAELGFAPEERQRAPHVTLARVRRARPRGPLTTFIVDHAETPVGRIDPSALVLFESRMQPGGSVYTPIRELGLGAGGAR
jgi:2'-5' RNA ligase